MLHRNHIHVNFRVLFNLLVLLIFTVAWAIPISAQSTDPDASEESRTYPIHAAHLNPNDSEWNGEISTQFITVGTDFTPINLPRYTGGSGTLTYSITDAHGHSASPGDLSSIGLAGLTFSLNAPSDTMYSGTITGELDGTSSDDSDSFILTYRAEDDEGQVGQIPFIIIIEDPMPSFGEEPNTHYTIVDNKDIIPFTLPKATSGTDIITYRVGQDDLPVGLLFDPNTRELSGTAMSDRSRDTYDFTYFATDEDGDIETLTIGINIQPDSIPVAPPVPDPYTFTVREQLTVSLPAFTGGNGDLTYSIHNRFGEVLAALSDISKLNGLNFDATMRTISGTLIGTDTDDSNRDDPDFITYRATDIDGDYAEIDIQINIVDPIPRFTVSEITLYAVLGAAFSKTLPVVETTSEDDTIVYSLYASTPPTSGSDTPRDAVLPTGLRDIADDNITIITGTPTNRNNLGTHTYIWSATNIDGDTASMTIKLVVSRDKTPMFLPDIPEFNFYVGQEIDVPLGSAVDGNPPYMYGLQNSGGENIVQHDGKIELDDFGFTGLSYNPMSQKITGTLKRLIVNGDVRMAYSDSFYHTVSDADTDPATKQFTISAVDLKPSFMSNEDEEDEQAQDTDDVRHITVIRGEFLSHSLPSVTVKDKTEGIVPDVDINEYINSLEASIAPALPGSFTFRRVSDQLQLFGQSMELIDPVPYTITLTDRNGEMNINCSMVVKACDIAELNITLSVVEDVPVMKSAPIGKITIMAGEDLTDEPKNLPIFTGGNAPLIYSLVNASGDAVMDGGSLVDLDSRLKGLEVELNSTHRRITGTITDTNGDDSTADIQLKYCVEDANGDRGITLFTLKVVDARPSFAYGTTIAPIDALRNVYLKQTLPAVAAETDDVTYSLSNSPALPNGLNFDPNTRILSGTPTEFQDANTYTYTATDSGGDTAILRFSIAVTNIASYPIASVKVTVGGDVNHVLQAFMGGSGRLTHSITDEDGNDITTDSRWAELGLEGLEYDRDTRTISGTLDGTPNNDSRTVTLKHKAVDANGAVGTRAFQVIVHDPVPSFGEAPSSLRLQARRGSYFFRYLPRVADYIDSDNTTYTLTRESTRGIEGLPPGLWFGDGYNFAQRWITGVIRGTATAVTVAPITYTYTAADADGDTASLSVTLSVVENGLLAPNYVRTYESQVGQPFSVFLPRGTGGSGPITYKLTDFDGVVVDETDGWRGVTYNQATQSLSGTYIGTPENDNGVKYLNLRVTDVNGEIVLRFQFVISGDVFPAFNTSTFNDSATSSGFTVAIIEGESVVLPFHRSFVTNNNIEELPIVIPGSGNEPITYSLTNSKTGEVAQISGFMHDQNKNTLVGSSNIYGTLARRVLTATDADGDTAKFYLSVYRQTLSLGDNTINNLTLTQGMEMTPLPLPLATALGYYSSWTYSLTPTVPPGLTFNPTTRTLSGIPSAMQSTTTYTYTVRGTVPQTDPQTDSITFTIEVVGSEEATLANQPKATIGLTPPTVEELTVMSGREMTPVVLPTFAYNGPHELVYSVTGLPQGIEFTPATRMLSGTPAVGGESAVTYIAEDNVRNAAATTFTLTVIDSTLTDATRSAIPAVSTSVAMAATASAAARIERALRGATQGLDISTAAGQSFQFDPTSSSNSSSSQRNPLRFGFWYNTATDELSDTRYEIATNSTTESSNFGFDVSLDFNPDTTLVLGVMQNNSATETEFSRVSGVGDEGALNLDLNSTALYAALGWRGLNVWAISGENDTQIADKASGVGLPVSFSYQTLGFSADFEVLKDLRIGARIETLQSDLNLPGVGRQLLGDLASAAAHTKATLTVNYEFELGKDSNGLLVPRFEFGTRNLSTSEQFQSTRSNARDTASELGFGLDYKQLDWGLTLGLDLRSMAVQNYSSKSMQWSVRWESGHYGKGLSLSLTPTTVAQTLGVNNIYNGDYGAFKSLANRQFSDDSAVSGEGVNVEMGVGLLSGTGTFTPFVRATNLYGSGASTQEFGLRYKTESATSYELKFSQQSRTGSTSNSLTSGNSAASSTRSDLESALEFSTRYSF